MCQRLVEKICKKEVSFCFIMCSTVCYCCFVWLFGFVLRLKTGFLLSIISGLLEFSRTALTFEIPPKLKRFGITEVISVKADLKQSRPADAVDDGCQIVPSLRVALWRMALEVLRTASPPSCTL